MTSPKRAPHRDGREVATSGRGLGSAMVRAFVEQLFQDPEVTRIQTDPSPDNESAIRSYRRAGFVSAGEIVTPDGPAVLMLRERSSHASTRRLSYPSGGRPGFNALNLLAQQPHEHETWERSDESQKKKRRPRQPQVLGVGRVACDRTDVHPPEGGERREQRVLRGGEAMVAQRHQQRDERRRPHAPGNILEAHREHHDRIVLPYEREPHESEYRHRLQNSETEERAIKAEPHHQRAAEQYSYDGRSKAHGLVHVANVLERKSSTAQ